MKAGRRVREFRELNDLSRTDLRRLLEAETGERYTADTVGRWERDQRHIPEAVLAFMEGREPGAGPDVSPPADGDAAGQQPNLGDTPPASPDGDPRDAGAAQVKPLQVTSQLYEKACVDLWDMIGFGVEIAGRGIGSPVVANDGLIIRGQSQELGRAYGKLAEQNETFRRIIVGLTQGGIWVEVTGVTVQLAMAIAQNHTAHAMAVRQARADAQAGEDAARASQSSDGVGGAAPHQAAA